MGDYENEQFTIEILQYLHQNMQPPNKPYDILGFSAILDNYLTHKNVTNKSKELGCLLEAARAIFIFSEQQAITYEHVNQYYFLSCQNRITNKNAFKSNMEFIENDAARARICQTVELCVMPQGDSSKIQALAAYEKLEPSKRHPMNVFVVGSQSLRQVSINRVNRVDHSKCLYHYHQIVKPMPLGIPELQNIKDKYLEVAEVSDNLIGMVTKSGKFLVQPKKTGIRDSCIFQGFIGDILRDKPTAQHEPRIDLQTTDEQSPTKNGDNFKVVFFQSYNDSLWVIVTSTDIFFYKIPDPHSAEATNNNFNFLYKAQKLPAQAQQAILLDQPYIAILLDQPCILILEIHFQGDTLYTISNKIFNDLRFVQIAYHHQNDYLFCSDYGAYLSRYTMNYHHGDVDEDGVVFSSGAGKKITSNLTSISLAAKSDKLGDTQLSGLLRSPTDKFSVHSMQIVARKSTDSYSEARLRIQGGKRPSLNRSGQIQYGQRVSNQNFVIEYPTSKKKHSKQILKDPKKQISKSLYTKPQKTQGTIIVKNSSRQLITLMQTNNRFSTLVTFEEQSIVPNGKDHDVQREWNHKKIFKLWDINHMTVYQTFQASVQISSMRLLDNGLYVVTKARGYLGYYSLMDMQTKKNVKTAESKDRTKEEVKERIFDRNIFIDGNKMVFCMQERDKYYDTESTKIYCLQLSETPAMNLFRKLPIFIKNLSYRKQLYVLNDASNNGQFTLHIYSVLGNKQKEKKQKRQLNFNNNFIRMTQLEANQDFNCVIWNKENYQFVGKDYGRSLTVLWNHSIDWAITQLTPGQRSLAVLSKQNGQPCQQISVFNLSSKRLAYQMYGKIACDVLFLFEGLLLLQSRKSEQLRVIDLGQPAHLHKCLATVLLKDSQCKQPHDFKIEKAILHLTSEGFLYLILFLKQEFYPAIRSQDSLESQFKVMIRKIDGYRTQTASYIEGDYIVPYEQMQQDKVQSRSDLTNISSSTTYFYETDVLKQPTSTPSYNLNQKGWVVYEIESKSKSHCGLGLKVLNYNKILGKAIMTISCNEFIKIYELTVCYKNKININLLHIGHIALGDTPSVVFWNKKYKEKTRKIWEQSKKNILQFSLQKITPQINLFNIPQESPGHTTDLPKNGDQLQQVLPPKVKADPQAMNQMLRKWHIHESMEYERQLKEYKKTDLSPKACSNQAQRQQRIGQLLKIPQQLRKNFKNPQSLESSPEQKQIGSSPLRGSISKAFKAAHNPHQNHKRNQKNAISSLKDLMIQRSEAGLGNTKNRLITSKITDINKTEKNIIIPVTNEEGRKCSSFSRYEDKTISNHQCFSSKNLALEEFTPNKNPCLPTWCSQHSELHKVPERSLIDSKISLCQIKSHKKPKRYLTQESKIDHLIQSIKQTKERFLPDIQQRKEILNQQMKKKSFIHSIQAQMLENKLLFSQKNNKMRKES